MSNHNNSATSRTKLSTFLLVLGIIFVAANLRTAITGVGPLIDVIKEDTGLSSVLAGMLTTFPLLAFAVFSPLAPGIARKMGIELTLALGLVVITAGILIRYVDSSITLLIGMLLAGIGITMGNVLLPSLIKRDFPGNVGLMTGIYSMSMNICAAIASGISVPISHVNGFGWRGSLVSWSILSIVAFIIWLPQLRNRHVPKHVASQTKLSTSSLAWAVTLFMGLQSLLFYSNVAWLPELLQSRGLSAGTAGWMLSLMQFVSLPASFIIPVLAGKFENQRRIIFFTFLLFLIGYIGLLSNGTTLTWLWVILIGVAGGAAISLALALFGLRTENANDAARLSGMAQSVGYLLAAVGPLLFGLFHDMSHSWTLPLIMLIVATLLLLFLGLKAGNNEVITAPNQKREQLKVGEE
ncbi:CP family cyanate transporter-like MFS transporter [Pullulanibacillus pueri]|uniref:Putative transporter YycB n=1 Tax=Pullulanibacillus pueri TaxID=1437324 RepID=A0A8J3EL03_9BACL|nr:MFS transporter [Pullulanibacillus pueri]MBM7681345.1 CP family cyanate transporter-like MFS transporter [Pullulanibacillus pueri]GGH77511.1 putative transporter YycB [Pullulanibacillus pueri]